MSCVRKVKIVLCSNLKRDHLNYIKIPTQQHSFAGQSGRMSPFVLDAHPSPICLPVVRVVLAEHVLPVSVNVPSLHEYS